ncbi:MAG: hypothetical protein Q8Q12_16705 [bacterium]|nr:hypothetical protein [bacterium]
MPASGDVMFDRDFDRRLREEAARAFEENAYIVVRRAKRFLGRKGRFELVEAVNCTPDPHSINELVDEQIFANSEVFGGDPAVRKIRFHLKWQK